MNRAWIADRTGKAGKLVPLLRKTLLFVMKELKLTNRDVSVALIRDSEMQRLNKMYRNQNRPTDVLSFSQNEPIIKKRMLLGDILISTPTARKQALATKHPLHVECSILMVHGLLHLLGHDHEKMEDARKMFRLQDKLLKRARILA